MSSLLKNTVLIKAMHFIAVIMVVFFLVTTVYQVIEINIQLSKKLITSEVYERLVTSFLKEVAELVMIVVMYFFGREVGKKEAADHV